MMGSRQMVTRGRDCGQGVKWWGLSTFLTTTQRNVRMAKALFEVRRNRDNKLMYVCARKPTAKKHRNKMQEEAGGKLPTEDAPHPYWHFRVTRGPDNIRARR